MRMVIIGNGPTGVFAAEAIREVDQQCEIIMIAKEEGPSYSPCPLGEYVEGTVRKDNLYIRDKNFYTRLNITTMFGREAVSVATQDREVILAGDERVAYDRLLIGIGSSSFFPPIPGLNNTEGVYALKTLEDAEGILEHIGEVEHAVVIGSGFIGLEAAQGLLHHGVEVTILEIQDQVLPQMLDADLAKKVQNILEGNGIHIKLNVKVEEILGASLGQRSAISAVKVDGKLIDCEMLISAAGVRPTLSIVEGTDIKTSHGILVDEHMQTSVSDVFAGGDIIEGKDLDGHMAVIPTWPNAVNSGRIAGYNMAGRKRSFCGLEGINVLRVFGVAIGSFGVTDGDKTMEWTGKGVNKRLFIEGNQIVGLQVVGDVNNMGLYLEMMKKGVDISRFGDSVLSPMFGYGNLVQVTAHKTAFAAAVK